MRHYWLTSDTPDLPVRAFRKALGKDRPETLEGGGGKGGDAPNPPDPNVVGAATTKTNQQTAEFNKWLNLNNSSNPFGSQQTTQVGTSASGAPIFQTNTTANPQLQGAIDSAMGQIGNSASINQNAIKGLMGLGSSLSPGAAQNAQLQGQNAAYKAQTQYLDPQFSQGQESMEAKLANQGLAPGSQAYDNAMTNFNNAKQQAYSNAANSAILTGSQLGTQNWQNQLAGIQAQSGLLGQQVNIGQLPYSNLQSLAALVPGSNMPATAAASAPDMAGLYNNQYQGQLAQYNANQQSANATTSGLFGLGTLGAMALFASDSRLKRDIKRIGKWINGLPVYTYRYIWEPLKTRHIGFMSKDVRKVAPHAVVCGADGFDRVNYQLAGGAHA